MADIPGQHRATMEQALAVIKALLPANTPVTILVAFPTQDDKGSHICSASNLIAEQQFEMMTCALEGLTPMPEGTTLN